MITKLVQLEQAISNLMSLSISFEDRMDRVNAILEPLADQADHLGIKATAHKEITLDLRSHWPLDRRSESVTFTAVFPDGLSAVNCYSNPNMALATAYLWWINKN